MILQEMDCDYDRSCVRDGVFGLDFGCRQARRLDGRVGLKCV